MSRQLPIHPNLEHLRKQAKDLLDVARPQHPGWQLADAQFALARDYGYASWPALKADVDRRAASTAPPAAAAAGPPAPSADDDADDTPLAGTWIANLAESTRHPAVSFRSATLTIATAGTRVTMTQVVHDDSGKPSGGSMIIETDGVARQPDGVGAAHRLTARWSDARTLEVVDSVDGQEQARGRYAVSTDGRRLVVSTADQQLVFDRA
jgi:hypothetical protein